jgi:hypothetical protein
MPMAPCRPTIRFQQASGNNCMIWTSLRNLFTSFPDTTRMFINDVGGPPGRRSTTAGSIAAGRRPATSNPFTGAALYYGGGPTVGCNHRRRVLQPATGSRQLHGRFRRLLQWVDPGVGDRVSRQ